jgi:hypothetical protein
MPAGASDRFIIFPSQRNLKMPLDFPKASSVRETLRAKLPNLDAGTRGSVVRALIENGHVQNDLSEDHLYAAAARTPLSPIQAAVAQPRRFAEVVGLCRQLGFHISASDTKPIDVIELDRAFAGKDVDARARCKTALYQIRMIPA